MTFPTRRMRLGPALAAVVGAAVTLSSPARGEPMAALEGRVTVRERKDGASVDRDRHGGAVVYVLGFEGPPRPGRSAAMVQFGKAFDPNVVAVTRGDRVAFPNQDGTYHNIFSLKPKFDLGQYRQGSKSVRFTELGVFQVFCNIHPQMVGWVVVVPNAAFAVAGADGRYRVEGIKPGRRTVVVWHPQAEVQTRELEFVAGAAASLDVAVDAVIPIAPHKDKYGVEYGADPGGRYGR